MVVSSYKNYKQLFKEFFKKVVLILFFSILLFWSSFSYTQSNQQSFNANLTCSPPASINYSVTNAFYCTGIPIAPNVLTYTGTQLTSLTITPDLPTGLIFDINTGTISGTPTVSVSGSYAINLVNPCGFISKTIYISVSTGINYYQDTDADGYGSGTATISCTGPPSGTVANNTDCAPTNPSKWRSENLFTDADNDGFDSGLPRVNVCYGTSIPSGYVLNYIGTDCNDNNAKINPNAVEVMGNGLDDNCDGFIDEVLPTTKLISSSCGVTIPSLSTTLFANPVSGAQAYRFEVTNGMNVYTYDTTLSQFNLLNLSPGVTYSSTNTYNTVRVALKLANHWRAYGAACSVTTPPVPNSTSVSIPACGSVLKNIWENIFCYEVTLASVYRFRVKRGTTLIGTYDSPTNSFNLVNLGVPLDFGVPYTIDVLLKIGSTWMPDTDYGTPCQIISPPTPGFSRVSFPSCGSSTNNLWTTIFAVPIVGAQGYKFVVTNGIQFKEILTSIPQFSIHDIPGGPMPGTSYNIRVDVLYNNSYVVGRETCTLNVLSSATRMAQAHSSLSDTQVAPNPFNDVFTLQTKSEIVAPIDIYVYDLMGRAIDSKKLVPNGFQSVDLGAEYPSGVYQIILKQSDEIKTLRIIKR